MQHRTRCLGGKIINQSRTEQPTVATRDGRQDSPDHPPSAHMSFGLEVYRQVILRPKRLLTGVFPMWAILNGSSGRAMPAGRMPTIVRRNGGPHRPTALRIGRPAPARRAPRDGQVAHARATASPPAPARRGAKEIPAPNPGRLRGPTRRRDSTAAGHRTLTPHHQTTRATRRRATCGEPDRAGANPSTPPATTRHLKEIDRSWYETAPRGAETYQDLSTLPPRCRHTGGEHVVGRQVTSWSTHARAGRARSAEGADPLGETHEPGPGGRRDGPGRALLRVSRAGGQRGAGGIGLVHSTSGIGR